MNNLKRLVIEAFGDIYCNTSPAADFYEVLYDNPSDNWFEGYWIREEIFEMIVEKYIKENKMTKYQASQFRQSLYLGPSPRFYPQNSSGKA